MPGASNKVGSLAPEIQVIADRHLDHAHVSDGEPDSGITGSPAQESWQGNLSPTPWHETRIENPPAQAPRSLGIVGRRASNSEDFLRADVPVTRRHTNSASLGPHLTEQLIGNGTANLPRCVAVSQHARRIKDRQASAPG
jgi:hypothetical protein